MADVDELGPDIVDVGAHGQGPELALARPLERDGQRLLTGGTGGAGHRSRWGGERTGGPQGGDGGGDRRRGRLGLGASRRHRHVGAVRRRWRRWIDDDVDELVAQAEDDLVRQSPDDDRDGGDLADRDPGVADRELFGGAARKVQGGDQLTRHNTRTKKPGPPDRFVDGQRDLQRCGVDPLPPFVRLLAGQLGDRGRLLGGLTRRHEQPHRLPGHGSRQVHGGAGSLHRRRRYELAVGVISEHGGFGRLLIR